MGHSLPAVVPHEGTAVVPHEGTAVVPHEGTAVVRLKLRVFCELVAKEGELNQHRGAR